MSIVAVCWILILGLFRASSAQQVNDLAVADKVAVDLYAESLCPFCARFTQQSLAPLFSNGLSDIVDLEVIMYGNAHNDSQGPICQHGPQECALNKIINCAIDLNPGQNKWFPYLECVEENVSKGVAAGKSCADQSGIPWDPIRECTNGPQGDELIVAAAKRTAALKPAHQYVPWVLVNDIPLGDAAGSLSTVICAAYDGKRPDVCFQEPVGSNDGMQLS